jgi:hypothetical protein
MKTKTKLGIGAVLMSGIFAIPQTGFTRDRDDRRSERYERRSDNRREAHRLEGQWYMNGDRNKPAEINGDGENLQARNENGDTSRLEVDRNGNIHASDWQGLTGHVRGNRIEWDNGTTWTRK